MASNILFETPRLALRPFLLQDAEHFYQLNADPEVLRYTGDEAFRSVDEARQFLEQYRHYQLYHYGRWTVLRKSDQEYLGWCGLKYTPELEEVDLGFRFFKKYWHQGYATESATACVHYGFDHLHLREIVGRAMLKNTASIRVLKKVGFCFWKYFDFEGRPGAYYKLRNHENSQ